MSEKNVLSTLSPAIFIQWWSWLGIRLMPHRLCEPSLWSYAQSSLFSCCSDENEENEHSQFCRRWRPRRGYFRRAATVAKTVGRSKAHVHLHLFRISMWAPGVQSGVTEYFIRKVHRADVALIWSLISSTTEWKLLVTGLIKHLSRLKFRNIIQSYVCVMMVLSWALYCYCCNSIITILY